MRSGRGLSIRSKLLLVAMAVLLIPWMGYEYVREMKAFLLQGQENALSLTARAVSTVLHDRPEFFDPETGAPDLIGEPGDLYAHALPNHIRLDGQVSDWGQQQLEQIHLYDGTEEPLCGPGYNADSLSFWHLLGYRGPYLYALFQVVDDQIIYRKLAYRRLDNSDHLRLTIQDPDRRQKRYILTARQPGRMSVYLVTDDWRYPVTGNPNYEIAAEFSPSEGGYIAELRIPRFLLSSQTRVGFAVADVDDDNQRAVERIVATQGDVLSRILVHSPQIAKILRGLDRPIARIWVLDKQRHVRAVVGQLARDVESTVTPSTWRSRLERWYDNLLSRIYALILQSPSDEFTDVAADISVRDEEIFRKALAGFPQATRRPSLDQRTEILVAAHPIWSGDEVLGTVVVEQSSNEVLHHHKQILENVISVTLIVVTVIAVALLVFASRITLRIRRLRNAAEQAIGPDGRVRTDRIAAESATGDEIGDLSRSVSSMLGRLSQYTRYLEGLPDTLAHELKNPLNVVNCSLDNLEKEVPAAHASKYMLRAKNGIIRLGSILTNLTEAANLEEALQAESREQFDLVNLVSSYVEGYRLSHPNRSFELDVRARPLRVDGVPDHIAQMLDKLADNAVDFGEAGSPIVVRLDRFGNQARISVLNHGPWLPETMQGRLFDPMISVGKKNAKQSRLGMGLYIVRLIAEYHSGNVEACNRSDVPGAMFTVSLPLAA